MLFHQIALGEPLEKPPAVELPGVAPLRASTQPAVCSTATGSRPQSGPTPLSPAEDAGIAWKNTIATSAKTKFRDH
jgi:hypothetical protein